MTGKVTVLMPVYNGMPYLRDAVQSVLDQTLSDWQCVIVNDGSSDGTQEFLDSIADDRFVIRHQANAGVSAAINHGLAYCKSPYVARLDADDVALPARLADQLAYMEANPEVGLVGTQVAPLGNRWSGSSLRLPLDHQGIVDALLDGRHAVVHSSIMVRTALLQQVGGYWSHPTGEEYDLMLRIGEVSQLANLDRVLVLWRVHQLSLTGSKMPMARFYIDYACELARRRRAGVIPITLDQFRAQRAARPWWQKSVERVELHARDQYRVALAEMYGGRPIRGRARMIWAATCAPKLTAERLARILRPSPGAGNAVAQHENTCQSAYEVTDLSLTV